MLSVIESGILNKFFIERPCAIETDEDLTKMAQWNDFREFIRSKSNLTIIDSNSLNPEIYKLLTDGQGETKKVFENKKVNLHGGLIHFETIPATFFCFVEPEFEKRKRIRIKNGNLIGFEDDYIETWKNLSLINKPTIISVNKHNSESFKSWNDFNSFLLPFTDIILSDPFILSKPKLIEPNLFTLWKTLDAANSIKYNFLIVTYEGDPKMDISTEYNRIEDFGIKNGLKGNVGLVFTSQNYKEHDRNLFMNYLRVKSGDTFNYFDSNQNFVTKGTEIDLYSCTEPQNEKATLSILKRITGIVKTITDNKLNPKFEGNISNRLLCY